METGNQRQTGNNRILFMVIESKGIMSELTRRRESKPLRRIILVEKHAPAARVQRFVRRRCGMIDAIRHSSVAEFQPRRDQDLLPNRRSIRHPPSRPRLHALVYAVLPQVKSQWRIRLPNGHQSGSSPSIVSQTNFNSPTPARSMAMRTSIRPFGAETMVAGIFDNDTGLR